MTHFSPRALAAAHLDTLFLHFAGVRDAQPDSVHQARVATRRLREVLPLLADGRTGEIEDTLSLVRSIGRQLGRVRELDVMHELLGREESRIPAAAAVIAVARQGLVPRQRAARRQMIKALEALEVDRLPEMLAPHLGRWDRLRDRYASRGWETMLVESIGSHAVKMGASVRHAAGVYLPNRSHGVRIAVKKLRYSVEVAVETGVWPASRLLRDLKKIQATLGDLHDVHVLADAVEDLVGDSPARQDLPMLNAALRAEAEQLQQRYLASRDRLLAAVAASERFAARGFGSRLARGARRLAFASSIAVPAGIFVLGMGQLAREAVAHERAGTTGEGNGATPRAIAVRRKAGRN